MSQDHVDVIIIGAGNAGIPCAIAAAQGGASVMLVDKSHHLGGTLQISGGHMSAAGTRRQASLGIEDNPDRHLTDIKRISNDTVRWDIVERAVRLAPTTLDWLEDNGFVYAPETPVIMYEHEPYSVARTYYGPDDGISILTVLKRLLDEQIAAGRVDLRLACAVTGLETDDGRVTGVSLTAGPIESTVTAAAIVLASGGFASNPELFHEIEGVPLVSAAMPTSTGDGLVMAQALGAGIAGQGKYLPTFGGMSSPGNPTRTAIIPRTNFRAQERDPYEIYVNRDGRRFVAEDDHSIDVKERALLITDDMTFWMIHDDAARVESDPPIVAGWSAADLAEQAGQHTAVHRADTLVRLAELAGIDADGLTATIGAYNEAIAADEPDPMGRSVRPAPIAIPPFYAIRNHGITLLTFSGVDVDADLRVRREDGTVIDGLYAVGEIIGNAVTAGNSFCGGMSVTPALALGRWLGAELAADRG